MPARRLRTTRNLSTLALHAPFVAAQRLTKLASNDPVTWWFGWQKLAWEKWFAGAEVAAALANAALTMAPRNGDAVLRRLTDASLVPVARRVRKNSAAIRRKR